MTAKLINFLRLDAIHKKSSMLYHALYKNLVNQVDQQTASTL